MDYQWLLLAFLFVFIVVGTVKALWHPLIKNVLRLACVPLAFLLTWIIQLCGGFSAISSAIVPAIVRSFNDFSEMPDTEAFLTASISSLVTICLFGIVFIVFLVLLRCIAVRIVFNIITRKSKETEDKNDGSEGKNEEKRENIGFKALSLLSGALGGFLILGVMLMPMFYIMDLISSATSTVRNSECDDSSLYCAIEVIDNNIVLPYENAITTKIYKNTGISGLMNATSSLGGNFVTESGEKANARDSLKILLSSGVDAAISVQSSKANAENLSNDIDALLSDPALMGIVSELVMTNTDTFFAVDENGEETVGDVVLSSLKDHYLQADKQIVSNDIRVLGDAIIYLHGEKVLTSVKIGSNGVEGLDAIINNDAVLEGTVRILTGISSYDMLLEYIYEYEIESVSDILGIPQDDKEAYDLLIEHLLSAVNSVEKDSFSVEDVEIFAEKFASNGLPITSIDFSDKSEGSDGMLYQEWKSYKDAWMSIHDAFSASCEDTTIGNIWIVSDGAMYFYYGETYVWEERAEIPEDYSPISSLCQYLASKAVSADKEVTKNTLITWLADFEEENTGASSALAVKLLNENEFESNAVTLEKMLASSDFKSWDGETKLQDSRLILKIWSKIRTVAENIPADDGTHDKEYVSKLIAQFGVLGEAMDLMHETSCITDLPEHLTQGLLQNDMFRNYINAGIITELNEAVKEDENMSYTSFMYSLKSLISLVIDKLDNVGGAK